MDILVYVACVVAFLAGIAFEMFIINQSGKKKTIGGLIIDTVNPEVNGGIYTVWDKDPHEMVRNGEIKNGQLITLEIIIADVLKDSQQNQGT